VQISRHPLDHRRLLVIFSTKYRKIRQNNVKQFGYHGSYSAEMRRPRDTFHPEGKRLLCHIGAELAAAVLWIHLLVRRREYHVHPFFTASPAIARQISRVFRKIFAWPKLSG